MDGGIQPERIIELKADEPWGGERRRNAVPIVYRKEKCMRVPIPMHRPLLPKERTKEVKAKQKWAVYLEEPAVTMHNGLKAVLLVTERPNSSSSFEIAGPLTEALLMANLAVRGHALKGGKKKYAAGQ